MSDKIKHVTDTSFNDEVLKSRVPSWSTTGPSGADPAK